LGGRKAQAWIWAMPSLVQPLPSSADVHGSPTTRHAVLPNTSFNNRLGSSMIYRSEYPTIPLPIPPPSCCHHPSTAPPSSRKKIVHHTSHLLIVVLLCCANSLFISPQLSCLPMTLGCIVQQHYYIGVYYLATQWHLRWRRGIILPCIGIWILPVNAPPSLRKKR